MRSKSHEFVPTAPGLLFLSPALTFGTQDGVGWPGNEVLAIASALESPMAYCKVFLDGDGVRWAACPHLAGEGTDAVPLGFSFTSQHGERRALDGVLADCVSWEDFDDHEWRELLMASRAVRPRKPRTSRRYNRYEPEPTRRARK
jgi:hypothetical protein